MKKMNTPPDDLALVAYFLVRLLEWMAEEESPSFDEREHQGTVAPKIVKPVALLEMREKKS